MLRHTAFFLLRDTTTPDHVLHMCKGLAYLRFECGSVRALDYGTDVFGGSHPLRENKPWLRTPLWRAERSGPVFNYDVALHLDFDDEAGLAAYNDDDVHHEVGEYDASVSFGEFTARVDYWYEGPPLIERGRVRHSAMFIWKDSVAASGRQTTFDAVRELDRQPGVSKVTVADSVGKLTTDYDWVMDVNLEDVASARSLLESKAYVELQEGLVEATKYEWTARLTHRMRGL